MLGRLARELLFPGPRLVVWVRHGKAEHNKRPAEEKKKLPYSSYGYKLVDIGRKQSAVTGAWLRTHFGAFDVYYTSTYVRSRESMEIMYPGVAYTEDARLAEVRKGVESILSEAQIHAFAPWEDERIEKEGPYHYRPWGGEAWSDVEMRLRSFKLDLRARHSGKTVLISSHGKVISIDRKIELGLLHEEIVHQHRVLHVRQENASVTIYRRVWDQANLRFALKLDPKEHNIVPWSQEPWGAEELAEPAAS